MQTMATFSEHFKNLRYLASGQVRGRLAEWTTLVPRIAALEEGLMAQRDYDL